MIRLARWPSGTGIGHVGLEVGSPGGITLPHDPTKKAETRARRIEAYVAMPAKGEKLHP